MTTAATARIPVAVARHFDGNGDAPSAEQVLQPGRGWYRLTEGTVMDVPLLCQLHRDGASQVTVRHDGRTADFSVSLMLRQEIPCSIS